MHNEIWKYTLQEQKETILDIPVGAVILTVQQQKEKPVLWALVDPEGPKEPRKFRLVATGERFDARWMTYIGTFTMHGWFVAHLFEKHVTLPDA